MAGSKGYPGGNKIVLKKCKVLDLETRLPRSTLSTLYWLNTILCYQGKFNKSYEYQQRVRESRHRDEGYELILLLDVRKRTIDYLAII